MKRWQGLAAAILVAVGGAGCGAAAAQEEKATIEHGVLEWVRYHSAKEDRERYSWATAEEEVQTRSAADRRWSAADRVCVLDHLATAGWELVNRTDVGYADAGGSAIAERYVLRRRR